MKRISKIVGQQERAKMIMKNRYSVLPSILVMMTTAGMLSVGSVAAQENQNPLAKYLAVPGATVTLPVNAAKNPFPLEFVEDARAKFENFHYQLGGGHALYYNGLHSLNIDHDSCALNGLHAAAFTPASKGEFKEALIYS